MEEYNRRTFIKKSILGGTGALVSSSFLYNSHAQNIIKNENTIIKRKLGKTGIELPIVSYGVMRADSPALLTAALEKGIVHFDTAHTYQGGNNEEMIGEVFKDIPRDSIVLSTKIKPEEIDRNTGEIGPATTKEVFLERLDTSLKRLKTDYVDILYVHALSSRNAVLHPELLEAVKLAKKQGKARHVGVSTHKNEPEVIKAVIESGVYEVVLTAINFKQDHYKEMKSAIADAANVGIGIVAMKTMAGGFHDRERTKPINCKAALKFVLQDENVTTSIPGITNFDQLNMNASINYDLTMTEQEKIDLVLEDKLEGGLYCQGCESCKKHCTKSLPIPEIMRAYMYTYGYNDSKKAHELLMSLNLNDNPCSDCKNCSVSCAKNFNVTKKITDVMRLTKVPTEFLS
ncbi:MAG: aldo/keto reductase [Ignavibacteriales bacterium]|nr:aldo/keto reductase [Ignavibacteriales bacterium]